MISEELMLGIDGARICQSFHVHETSQDDVDNLIIS